ncbi:response regulator [Maribacter halichondriae]|uniref:response regulator n=1 Tax=Maribacter halichondriae TaxID=2980554 RepID=UPI0023590C13|nr:response regulator [Maribacter sp. Hal144]
MPTILLIEDDCTIRENTAEFLELEGYRTITAVNGKDGFDKIFRHIPDLIVCDLLMPEMGGLQLLAKLGNYKSLKTIPLIIYSAKNEKRDIKNSLELGAYDYIVKPSDLEDLLVSIRRCLQSKLIS